MSASEDEAFASAEEGEEGARGGSGKSRKSGEASKSPPPLAKDKGGGKQKGKQQPRKKKAKGQSKPATDEKEKPSPKTPSVESPVKTSGAVEVEQAPASEKAGKEETTRLPAPSDDKVSCSQASESVKPYTKDSESVKPSTKDSSQADFTSDKQDSSIETDSGKESEKEKQPESASEEKSETQAKSAGEIRQSLSSSTTAEDNPADQAILRDAGGDAADSEKAESGQTAAGDGAQSGGGWNWGWGSSLLNAATNSIETFSSQVGEGLTTIIDTVESSLGVPNPEEMVRADSALEPATEPNGVDTGNHALVTAQPQEKEASAEPASKAAPEAKKGEEGEGGAAATAEAETDGGRKAKEGGGWLSGWGMSNISSMGKSLVNKSQTLMNTGFEKAETLAAGGLDILESIGKKTYSTLTEHDPGLRRAREFLHMRDEKPSLSSVLREAQEKAEEQAKHDKESEEARKCNFTALFEDNQGLAHLEALEMLSNQSERKVQSLLSAMEEEMVESIRPQLIEIKDTFQQAYDTEGKEEQEETEHDFSKLVTENLSELHLGTAPDKLNKVQETVRQWIADFYSHEDHSEISDAKEVQQRAIQALADVTSKSVEQFHKAGELVLMQKDQEKSYTDRAQNLARLSSVLVTEVDILANKFSQCLNKIGEEQNTTEEVNPMVTSVYLEASNASGYIQDAFQLLLPVLQHAAIQSALTL